MTNGRWNLFPGLIFLYFSTLHADQLNFVLGGYTFRFNNLIALLLLLLLAIHLRSHLFSIDKWLAIPLALIAFSITLSWAFSSYHVRAFFYLAWYGLTLLCYVLVPYFLMKWEGADKIFSLYLYSFIPVGIYATLQLLFSCFGLQDPFTSQVLSGNIVRPNAFCFEPSFYALYMTPFVFFYNSQYLTSQKKKLLWPVLGVNFLYLISTSTSIIFAYALFIVILMLFRKIDKKKILYFSGALSLTMVTLFLLFPYFLKTFLLKFFFHGFMAHGSFYERWIGIENGWKMFLDHPLLGVGLGSYPAHLMESFLGGDTTFTYFGLTGEEKNPLKMFEAMNVSTELLASLGLIGVFAFSSLLVGLWAKARQAFRFNSALTISLIASLLVTLMVLQFNQGLFRTYIWVHLALTFAFLEKLKVA